VRNNGIIIVDSTRRGKTVPDALSKTIPIWCATLNYVMFGNSTLSGKEGKSNWLFLPKQIISESEQNSIMKMIPQFAEELLNLKTVTKEQLLGKFQGKYLRPMWVYPGMVLPFESPQYDDFYPIINCVASRKAQDGTVKLNGFNYVQGAADDHELWADCLTPKLFWGNIDLLKNIELSDSEILKVIGNLEVKKSATSIDGLVNMTDRLSVGKVCGDVSLGDINDFQTIILLSKEYSFIEFDEKKQLLKYPLLSNKKGSNDLRKFLPEIIREVNQNWDNPSLILCDTGSDLSIGVVLALLALHYDLNWTEKSDILITKDVLKRHLAKLLEIKKVNPSRATLQSINSFLM
jgi:tRNA A64-2'-O-ribosylphosphate transferase